MLGEEERQRALSRIKYVPSNLEGIKPLKRCPKKEKEDASLGLSLIRQGQLATIILAGGQATRLGFGKCKGLFPFYKGKSLFECFCEKIRKAEKKYKVQLFTAYMVSQLDRDEVEDFFERNNFFGLQGRVFLFFQKSLPLFDRSFKEISGRGPDGNGAVFNRFEKSGLLLKFQEKGIRYISLVSIDNLLADPFDEKFLSFHCRTNSDVSIKCILKEKNTGYLGRCKNKICIVDYVDSDGAGFFYSNTGSYFLNLDFIRKAANITLPYHVAKKQMGGIRSYKFEKFVFDAFTYSRKTSALLDDANKCFLPLKSRKNIKEIQAYLDKGFYHFLI